MAAVSDQPYTFLAMEVEEPLDEPSVAFRLAPDRRPLLPEPLPVKLIAIEDVRLPATAGREVELDAFYVKLFGFERDEAVGNGTIAYHAENLRLCFDVGESLPERPDMRPIGIEVLSLADTERKLIEARLDYTKQRGLFVGQEHLLLQDPAGNWIALVETRVVT